MKKLNKLFALAAAIASLAMAGCSNVSGATVSPEIRQVNPYHTELTVKVESAEDIVDFSRTIMPDALAASSLTFYLKGVNKISGRADFDLSEVVYTSITTKTGSITVDIPTEYYSFTLYAVADVPATISDTTIPAAAVLVGFAEADLRYNQAVKFYLTPNKLTNNGSIRIGTYASDDANTGWDFDKHAPADISNIVMGLFPLTATATNAAGAAVTGAFQDFTALIAADDELWKSTQASDGSDTITTTVVASGASDGYAAASHDNKYMCLVADAIAPGTYNFVMTFFYKGKEYEYSDKLIVLPNQETAKLISIPDVIEYAPAAPTELTAYYGVPELTAQYYPVYFTWKDNSVNEQYFVLQLADVTKAPANFTDTPVSIVLPEDALDDGTGAGTYNLEDSMANGGPDTPTPTTGAAKKWLDARTAAGTTGTAYLTQYTYNFYGDRKAWEDGSLLKNNEEILIRLPLGKRYLARIAAYNAAGQSEWNYVKLGWTGAVDAGGNPTQGDTQATALSDTSTTYYEFPTYTTAGGDVHGSINLYRLTYNTNNGTFATATPTVRYLTQNDVDGERIIVPDGLTDVRLRQNVTNKVWTGWKLNGVSGPDYPGIKPYYIKAEDSLITSYDTSLWYYKTPVATPVGETDPEEMTAGMTATRNTAITDATTFAAATAADALVETQWCKPYRGFDNITLVANYNKAELDVDIYQDSDYKIDGSTISIAASAAGGTDGTITTTLLQGQDVDTIYAEIARNITADSPLSELTFTVANAGWLNKYDKMELSIVRDSQYTASNTGDNYVFTWASSSADATVNVSIGERQAGTYIATVKGYTSLKTKTPYTCTIIINLAD